MGQAKRKRLDAVGADPIKDKVRWVANWFLILTRPLWGGFLLGYMFLTAQDGFVRDSRRGRRWLLE